jgi:hypothetical protein
VRTDCVPARRRAAWPVPPHQPYVCGSLAHARHLGGPRCLLEGHAPSWPQCRLTVCANADAMERVPPGRAGGMATQQKGRGRDTHKTEKRGHGRLHNRKEAGRTSTIPGKRLAPPMALPSALPMAVPDGPSRRETLHLRIPSDALSARCRGSGQACMAGVLLLACVSAARSGERRRWLPQAIVQAVE